jgi:formate dehydrogenase subunit gamma
MSATTVNPRAGAAEDQVQRYTYKERLCHWISAVTYLYCFFTGLAIYSPYLFWIATILGGGPTVRFWHPIFGVGFVATAIWMHQLWRADMGSTAEDREWLKKVKYYATNRDDLVPPQWRFNAGQKEFYWAMFYGALGLLITGLVMWFPEYVPRGLFWLRPVVVILHCIAALVTIGAFMIHIYMGLFVVPGSLHAIVTGFVSRDWARTHHRLWYEKVTRNSPGNSPDRS